VLSRLDLRAALDAIPAELRRALEVAAERIRAYHALQAGAAEPALDRDGVSLREQVGFGAYLEARRERPSLTFREHLRAVGGAIEE